MSEPFAPRPVGAETKSIELRGMLIPWGDDNQVVLAKMSGCEDFFLPLFSSEDLLRATLGRAKMEFVQIKKVDDPKTFLEALPYFHGGPPTLLRVVVDLRFTEEGRVRFTEVQRAGGEA